MKEKRKSLQKWENKAGRALLSAAVSVLFVLLVFIVLILVWPRGEKENGTEVSFDDDGNLFDETTTVDVLIGGEVNEMPLSDYLARVIGAEMPALYPKEALKAQAIAARTNVMYKKALREEKPASASHRDADVCAESSHCQAYASEEKLRDKWGENFDEYMKLIREAVKECDGEIITYEGEPISAIFHAVSSGRTENAQDVWGGRVPYLLSVESPWDREHAKFETQVTLGSEEFKNTFLDRYPEAVFPEEPGEWIEGVMRSEAGGITEMKVAGVAVSGRVFRHLYGLRSTNIAFSFGEKEITMTVHGFGHGVGMSQYGARGMALEGKTAEEIVKWYYTGTEVKKLLAPLLAGPALRQQR